jgi:hypothetical protein
MTEQQAQNKIEKAGGDMKVFWKWMSGQTMGLNEDGTTYIYDCDVDRFIRYKCDPKNEPLSDWD